MAVKGKSILPILWILGGECPIVNPMWIFHGFSMQIALAPGFGKNQIIGIADLLFICYDNSLASRVTPLTLRISI
jgi:hypothetical protein